MIPRWLRRLICFPQFNLDIRVSPADLRVFSTFHFLLFVQLKKKVLQNIFQWDSVGSSRVACQGGIAANRVEVGPGVTRRFTI